MTELHVYDKKYTVILNDNGTMAEILRYGEPWPAGEGYVHHGFVLALVQDLLEAREG